LSAAGNRTVHADKIALTIKSVAATNDFANGGTGQLGSLTP